ncbi:hypothetical protein NU219Hw_g4045t1 [Hortaea werneckii]
MHKPQLLIALASASGVAALAHLEMREYNRTERIVENFTMSGVFNIHAQLCLPFKPPERTADLGQIASHGAHYDSRYWDVQLDPEERSWANTALREGYGILTYDRLGAGQSDHPDAYQVVQAELELDVLRSITQLARKGTFYRTDAPLRITHVGHSFGSFLTSAFIARFIKLSDAAVITSYVATDLLGSVGTSPWSVQYAADARPGFDGGSGYVLNQKSGIHDRCR